MQIPYQTYNNTGFPVIKIFCFSLEFWNIFGMILVLYCNELFLDKMKKVKINLVV